MSAVIERWNIGLEAIFVKIADILSSIGIENEETLGL